MAASRDDFFAYTSDLSSPASNVALVTPSDTVDIPDICRAFSMAVVGALKVTTIGGQTVVIPSGALPAGQIIPIRLSRIWATGTTATGIVAYW